MQYVHKRRQSCGLLVSICLAILTSNLHLAYLPSSRTTISHRRFASTDRRRLIRSPEQQPRSFTCSLRWLEPGRSSSTASMTSVSSSSGTSSFSYNFDINGRVDNDNDDDDDYHDDDDDDEVVQILSYLPDHGRNLPRQIKSLIVRVTNGYIYGSAVATKGTSSTKLSKTTRTTLEEISALIELEHRSRDVPVIVGDVIADVTVSGEALDEACAKILSLAALYRLPKEITLELLQSPLSNVEPSTCSLTEIRTAFMKNGWEGVSFPMGLAVRPKTKFRFSWGRPTTAIRDTDGRRVRLSWWHRTRTLQAEANVAVAAAAKIRPPARQLLDPLEFLKTMDAQLIARVDTPPPPATTSAMTTVQPTTTGGPSTGDSSDLTLISLPPSIRAAASTTTATLGQLFFPHNDERIGMLRRFRRVISKQYSSLKRQGRAGFVAYCFFNCALYTFGILWQWPRMTVPDPLTSNLTVTALVARKFGKVFAYLYALSQLLKVPKLFTAVTLAPFAGRSLQVLQERFNINETVATILMVGLMIVFWCTLTAFPLVSEYSSLKRVIQLDEQLMQVYGLQPV